VFSSNGGMLATFDYLKRGRESKFYWSRTDDLLIWNLEELWWADGAAIRSGFPFLFEWIDDPKLNHPMGRGRTDVTPEHVQRKVRRVGGLDPYVAAFDLPSLTLLNPEITAGPFIIAGEDQVAWTQSDVFIRLIRKTTTPRERHLEILAPGSEPDWGLFAPLTFPDNARLLLVRDNEARNIPEALILWRDVQSISHVGLIRLGSSTPVIIAEGYIHDVFLSPDRTRIYGYSDHAGRFHPLLSEQHGSDVLFWLDQFRQMDALEAFYLLDNARYAVIKRNSGAAGPEAVILEKRGSATATLHHLCQTNSPVKSILEGANSVLFVPKADAGDKLAVYLHDDPFASVGRGGDWITDIVVRTGIPVLAINYFGSSSRMRELSIAREIVPLLAADIEDALDFARAKLPGKTRELAFVAQGFGSFVGFSAIMADAARPERFVILSGVTDPRHVFRDHVPGRDPLQLNYLSRAGRQLGPVMNPEAGPSRSTRFLFIHGDEDDKVAHGDVARFVKRLNAMPRQAGADLLTVEGMGHSPDAKADYETILDAVRQFLGTP
jgi:hypothetical protein